MFFQDGGCRVCDRSFSFFFRNDMFQASKKHDRDKFNIS